MTFLKYAPGLLLLFVAHFSAAQFTWGVRTGVQFSGVRFRTGAVTAKPTFSYLIPGLFARYQISNRFAVSQELLYERKGYQFPNNNSGQQTGPGNEVIVFPFVSTYTLFHLKIAPGFEVHAGPEYGIGTNTVAIIDGERFPGHEAQGKRFDFGIAAGVAWQFMPGYSLNLRYTQGLLYHGNQYPYDDRLRNHALQLSLNSVFDGSKIRSQQIVSFGVHQGIISSTVQVRDASDNLQISTKRTYRKGVETGLDVRFNIRDYFYVASGVTYLQKGGSIGNDPGVKLSYLSLPVIVGVTPFRSREFSLSLDGGLGLNLQVSASNPYNASSAHEADKQTATFFYGVEAATDVFNKFTLFAHYRKFFDNSPFTESTSGGSDYMSYATRGYSISIGIRQHHARRPARPVSLTDSSELIQKSAFGFKVGLPVSWTVYHDKPSDAPAVAPTIGLTTGLFFKIRTGKRTAVGAEFQYSVVRSGVSAIENPVLFTYALSKRWSIEGGAQWRIFLKTGERTIGQYSEAFQRPIDFGPLFGTQYKIKKNISLGVRYYHSTTDLAAWYDAAGLQTSTGGYLRNVQVCTFFSF